MADKTETEPRAQAGNAVARGLSAPDFGAVHHHKPTKTIVGVTILVLLSFVFYELGNKPAVHSAAPLHQTVASSSR